MRRSMHKPMHKPMHRAVATERKVTSTRSARTRELPPEEAVRAEWLRRVEAEYRSAALTQHLTLWLIQLAAPPDLIDLGLRIVRDELAHAELSAAVYRAARGDAPPQLARETLCLARTPGESLERDVLRVAVEQFCLGETVAVRLFHRMRHAGRPRPVVRALDRILRDEVVHRDFGWALLEWLLSTPLAQEFRVQLASELPAMLSRLRASYGGLVLQRLGADELEKRERGLSESARAWGLLPTTGYLAAVDETVARDYRPRFRALGIAFHD